MIRRTVRALIVSAVVAALAAGPAIADEDTLTLAKAAYEDRADLDRLFESVKLFRQAAEESPDSYEARWMGARAASWIGTYPWEDGDKARRMELFEVWIVFAKEAVALHPERGDAHFWLGVLFGLYGQAKGLIKSLALIPRIKEELNLSLAIDPSLEAHGPDRAVGRMLLKLPWFKGGDNDAAVTHLERAVERAPQHPLNHLYLAESYKKIGRRDEAVAVLRTFLAMEPSPEFAPEHVWVADWARTMLKKVE